MLIDHILTTIQTLTYLQQWGNNPHLQDALIALQNALQHEIGADND